MLNGVTTDDDLWSFASKAGIHLNYIGFKDTIPNKLKNGGYIINLASSTDKSGGTHWVALWVDLKEKKSFYFDSFGFESPIEIENASTKNNLEEFYNTNQIQKLNSDFCGSFCLLFLYSMQYNHGPLAERFNDFLNLFK